MWFLKVIVADVVLADHIVRLSGMLRQYKFLRKIIKRMKSPDRSVELMACLEKLRKVVTEPERIRIHMSTDVSKLVEHCKDPVAPWLNVFFRDITSVSPER